MNAKEMLTTARTKLLIQHSFFGMLALRLKLVERNEIPTAAVDGRNIFYNAKFIESLPPEQVKTLVAHEVMHCVFEHMSRRGARDPRGWNQAGDFAINIVLEDSGFEAIPGWLCDPAYRDMSTDQIYEMLPKDDGSGGGGGNGIGDALDEVLDADPADETAAIEWKVATAQAATAAKAQGHLPGSLKRFIDELTNPKLNWREILHRFVAQTAADDYSWSRPSEKFLNYGFYMPSLYSETVGEMAVAIDTSGSITQEMLNTFGAEIKAIVDNVRPQRLHVIYCDAAVNHVDVFHVGEPVSFELHGGGGTAFKPVFDYLEENAISPSCAVYLTDLYGDHSFDAPAYPVLWCCTSDQTASFGETIKLDA